MGLMVFLRPFCFKIDLAFGDGDGGVIGVGWSFVLVFLGRALGLI